MQVEAFRACVNFKSHSAAHSLSGNTFKVVCIGVAMQEEAAGWMAERPEVRASERAQEAIGHFGGLHFHVTVNAADHEIKFPKSIVLDAHVALFPDVALQAREHANDEAALSHLTNLA